MTHKIKVMQLGSSSGLYGAERWIFALIKHLDPEKVESLVGAIKDESTGDVPLCTDATQMGYESHVIESSGRIDLSAVTKLKECVIKNNIDILHTHGYKTDLVGRAATLGTRCKIISTPHGWTNKPDIKLALYEVLDRIVFPFFDVVAPLSEGILLPLRRIPGLKNKLKLIRNGVDISEIDAISSASEEITSLKDDGKFVIGYIGRLTHGKGLDILFKSIAECANHNWKVIIIGEGEQKEELILLAKSLAISDKIQFLGFREDRLALLKGFDVFVLPSRSEGIPRCLMEAMAAEVPVIASDIPGCRYLIDGKSTGLLHKVDDFKGLASLLNKLHDNIDLRDYLRKSARTFIDTKYSAARMAIQYEELYFDMLKD